MQFKLEYEIVFQEFDVFPFLGLFTTKTAFLCINTLETLKYKNCSSEDRVYSRESFYRDDAL